MPRADVRTVKKYAEMFTKRKALEDQVKAIKQEMSGMEESIAEYFQRQGMNNWNGVDATVYIRRELWAGLLPGVDILELKAAVEGTDYEPAVQPKMNTQTMSGIMRERDAQMRQEGTRPNDIQHIVPEELRRFISLKETFKIGVRKK